MCGRYTLKEKTKDLSARLGAKCTESDENLTPTYNAAPTQRLPIVRQAARQGRVMEAYRWGLLPAWAKDTNAGYNLINARAESLDSKRSFKPSFKSQRCLVPASGFYEWKGNRGNKTPYYIYPTNAPFFAFAGLYSVWKSPEGEEVPTYTIVTTKANSKMRELHDRMPAILLQDEWDLWLDPNFDDAKALTELLDPFPVDAIDYFQVSRQVNNVRNNSPKLIEPFTNELFG
jgi:putative SOS response-associated peptidase YedK